MSADGPAAGRRWPVRARRLTSGEARDLAAAVPALLLARLRFACRPTAALVRELRARSAVPPRRAAPGGPDPAIGRASNAVARAAARVPWRADCLIQALALERMLRRRGHAAQFHLGVARDPSGQFTAHAWLVCDGVTVSGGAVGGFSVLIGPEGALADAPAQGAE